MAGARVKFVDHDNKAVRDLAWKTSRTVNEAKTKLDKDYGFQGAFSVLHQAIKEGCFITEAFQRLLLDGNVSGRLHMCCKLSEPA